MFEVVPFKAEHLWAIRSEEIEKFFFPELAKAMEKEKHLTFMAAGQPKVCAGITPIWNGRGIMWCHFSSDARGYFLPIFRATRKWLAFELANNYHRIELSADIDVPQARRRAEMLGFKCEINNARKYLPNQKDCAVYAMVRE